MKDVVTYLTFDGNCREAMEFYRACFQAELYLMPFSGAPVDLFEQAGHAGDRILHSTLRKGSRLLMASDTMPGMTLQPGNNLSVLIECESLQEIEELFLSLGEGGKVTMPLQDTFWDARFGTLTDRFGIQWMFNFARPKPG